MSLLSITAQAGQEKDLLYPEQVSRSLEHRTITGLESEQALVEVFV